MLQVHFPKLPKIQISLLISPSARARQLIHLLIMQPLPSGVQSCAILMHYFDTIVGETLSRAACSDRAMLNPPESVRVIVPKS